MAAAAVANPGAEAQWRRKTNSWLRANAGALAQAEIYNRMNRQASALSYVDVFWILCAASILMVPLAFLLDKNNTREHRGAVMMD